MQQRKKGSRKTRENSANKEREERKSGAGAAKIDMKVIVDHILHHFFC